MRLGRTRPSYQPTRSPSSSSSKANSHSPFRLVHSSRTNCGRGYSGRGTVFQSKDMVIRYWLLQPVVKSVLQTLCVVAATLQPVADKCHALRPCLDNPTIRYSND